MEATRLQAPFDWTAELAPKVITFSPATGLSEPLDLFQDQRQATVGPRLKEDHVKLMVPFLDPVRSQWLSSCEAFHLANAIRLGQCECLVCIIHRLRRSYPSTFKSGEGKRERG
eukprot:GHVU01051612.1.p2 GENE.GHVU01051612.1~~GHVU01051612.1.p2  ORF type:complete len:114 (-),score=8.36 GHVU01051612.1:1351-1692(-)